MIGFRRFLLVITATIGLAGAAWAEGIFPVNAAGTGSWVFDQPSVVAYGSLLHIAFVGDSAAGVFNADNTVNTSLDTRLYYAAVNGGVNFKDKATTRTEVLLTAPVAIDNGDGYTDARHPHIAMRSSTELVILFQAIPVGDDNYKLFRALVRIDNNAVTSQSVNEIRDAAGARIPGKLTDPSFAIVTADNTMRVAFSSSPSLVAGSPYSDVYYARVRLDNGRVANNAILLTNTTASTGVLPLPRLKIDSNKYSHIAWAANNSDPARTTPAGVYYAMVHAVSPSVVDNLAIGATQVLSGGYRWGFPSVLITSSRYVWILAADEPPSGWSTGMAGSLGISEVNPYAVKHDGNPVNVNNINNGSNSSFFLNPPGGSVLSANFDAYQPETALDIQNRVHVAGYGFRYPDGHGTPGRYFAMSLGSTSTGSGTTSVFATMVASPVYVGTGDIAFAMQLPDDYTRPAFVHFSGRSINLWSGPDNVVAGARNLYITSSYSPANSTSQSGCSMVDDPRRGEAGRIPGTAVLLLPAVLLALRRATRKAFAR
ncbi:MAG: hypothetical protein ACYC24_01210 [Desulfobacteria bacterium]